MYININSETRASGFFFVILVKFSEILSGFLCDTHQVSCEILVKLSVILKFSVRYLSSSDTRQVFCEILVRFSVRYSSSSLWDARQVVWDTRQVFCEILVALSVTIIKLTVRYSSSRVLVKFYVKYPSGFLWDSSQVVWDTRQVVCEILVNISPSKFPL